MESSEDDENQLEIVDDLKKEIEDYVTKCLIDEGLPLKFLKLKAEQIDYFVNQLKEYGLNDAFNAIESQIPRNTLRILKKAFEPESQFGNIKKLWKQLCPKSQLYKKKMYKNSSKIFGKKIFDRNDYYDLYKDLPAMIQEIFETSLETFLNSYKKVGFLDRLEFYYIAKTDKEIMEELKASNFKTKEKNESIKRIEAEVKLLLENDNIEEEIRTSLFAEFLATLDFEALLKNVEENVIKKKFKEVESLFKNNQIIKESFLVIQRIDAEEEENKLKEMDELEKLEMYYKIVQHIKRHIFYKLPEEILETFLMLLREPNLEKFISTLEGEIPPKHFWVIHTNIKEDNDLQKLIENYKKLINYFENNNIKNNKTILFELEEELLKNFSYYKYNQVTEEAWIQATNILKEELNLEQALKVLEDEIPPIDFQELKCFIRQDKKLARILEELEKFVLEEKKRESHPSLQTEEEERTFSELKKDKEIIGVNGSQDNPELAAKTKNIASIVDLPKIEFKKFNMVTFRPSAEEQTTMIRNWIANLGDTKTFEELLPIYFNLLKRAEHWQSFQEAANYSILDQNRVKTLGFFHSKFLFYLLMISADNELKARILQLYGTYNPVPLKYQKWPSMESQLSTNLMEYKYNEQLYYHIKPSVGIFSFGLGQKASSQLGKSTILNQIFMTNFATKVEPQFHFGTIDIDLDIKFRPSRNFCIADAHGRFVLEELPMFLNIFKLLIVHVHSQDLEDENTAKDLKYLCTVIEEAKANVSLNVIIRDNESTEDLEDDSEKLQREYPQLTTLSDQIKEESLQIIALRALSDQGDRTQLSQIIYRKLQKKILASVEKVQHDLSLNKELFITKFLHGFGQDKEINKVHKAIQSFIQELQKYSDNFFDQGAFPYRYYFSILRKAQNVLRAAKNEDELLEAKSKVNEVQSELRQVKATKIMKLFGELLAHPNSYLILMEISKEIKLIVETSSEKYFENKEELEKEILELKKQDRSDLMTKEKYLAEEKELNSLLILVTEEISNRSLSIEVLWRELIALYTYNEKEVFDIMKVDPVNKIEEFLEKGEPFELIDGDNLQFNEGMLEKLFSRMKGKMCNVSILGPQSSGKSTLLNYLFGCQFISSVGRCTRGIYLSLLKINKNPHYDYLMILDTEGLQSAEKDDEEFDKKITLFCLAVSQIIVLNIKGDLHLPMKSLLQICTLSLSEIEKAKIEQPAFYYVFNQNPSKNKSAFMTQIGDMLNEVLESDEQVIKAANILRPDDQNVHILGFAYKVSQIERNKNQNIWRDWSYIEPQSSFAIDSSALARVINDKIKTKAVLNSKNQGGLLDFVEWSGLANQIWKTIDMFPNIINFSEFRIFKQERELLTYCNQIIEDKKEMINQLKSKGKLNVKNLDECFNEIKTEVEKEILSIRKRCQYDYDHTMKHIKDSHAKIDAYKSEIFLALDKVVLQDLIQEEQYKGFKEISERISESLLDPAIRGSKEKATSKFDAIWREYIEDNLSKIVNIKDTDKQMWDILTKVYMTQTSDFPDHKIETIKKLKETINPDTNKRFNETNRELNKLIQEILNEIKALGVQNKLLQEDEKSEIFLKDIYIKYRQPAFYLSLPDFLSPTLVMKYINIRDLLKDKVDWTMFKADLLASINPSHVNKASLSSASLAIHNQAALSTLNSIQSGYDSFKNSNNYNIFNNIVSLLLVFEPFGYLPDSFLISDIKDSLQGGTLTVQTIEKYLKHYSSLDKMFDFIEIPKFDSEQSVPSIKYFKNPIIESKRIEGKTIDDALKEMSGFSNQSYNLSILKNYTWIFTPKNPAYEEGLKFCVNPYDQSIARNTARENLKNLITTNTAWEKFLGDVCADIVKEVDVKASYLNQPGEGNIQDIYSRDVSSFSVDLMKNIVKTVNSKINLFNKEILRCGYKLNRSGRGNIHFYSLLITWKILSFASKKRLMDPIEKIKKEKEKWQAYFVSSVNSNFYDKSVSFADRIITEYIEKIKLGALKEIIAPAAGEFMKAKKSEFNVVKIQKRIDDAILLADSGQSDKVLDYLSNQTKYFEKEFDKLWNDHYSLLFKEQTQKYKETIIQRLDSLMKTIFQLQEFFKTFHRKRNIMPLDMLEIHDSQGQSVSIDSDLTIDQINNNNTELVEFWSVASFHLFIQYCKDHISDKWTYTNSKYTAKVKGLTKNLRPEVPINFIKGSSLGEKENQIPLLYIFLEKMQDILIAERNIISSTDLNWGHATLGLDFIYQTYKNNSIGCPENCPTCGRKCDRLGDNHLHRCENGHQIRGMYGIKQGSTLSRRTCDEIKPDSDLQIDQLSTKMKWKDYIKKFPEWDFTPFDQKNPPETIFKFRNCWNLHGPEFCRYYSNLYNQHITYDAVLEIDSYHFILVLDGSGSMKGKPWENAQSGATTFLNKLKELESKLKNVSVSLIVFTNKAQVLARYEKVSAHLSEKLKFPGGGTDFDAPLQSAYQLIEGNDKFDKHVILFYTDGGASYPTHAMTRITNYVDKSKILFYALSAEKNPLVLINIANQFNSFSTGEVKANISPDMLVNELPEILNSMFHQV